MKEEDKNNNQGTENPEEKVEESKTSTDTGKEEKENTEKTFTQKQLDDAVNGMKENLYKQMGISGDDDKMIKMFKSFVDSQKTEEQKAADQTAENQRQLAEAEQRALTAEIKAEAMTMGANAANVEDIVVLAMAKITKEKAEAKTVIAELKTKYPVWFETKDKDDDENKGKKGTGSSLNGLEKKKDNKGVSGLGARLAAKRKSENKKSSYWD